MKTAQLNASDQKTLRAYGRLAEQIGNLLGPFCEVVIHSLENLDASVVKIVNGHNTGRAVGAPITDKALKILNQYQSVAEPEPPLPYYVKHKDATLFRSVTHVIEGENGQPIGLFCINMNLCAPFAELCAALVPGLVTGVSGDSEYFGSNPAEAVSQALRKSRMEVDLEEGLSPKQRNRAIVKKLYEAGIFKLKESIALAAEELGITKHTVYKHLREFKNGPAPDAAEPYGPQL
ncbi:MAG: PAS domain-containing protein [Deltaproteobacteria bacterium]|jgi:predicted transcriptional regulator YheO|nr:PAS domain-containing protein [Deltaproteobacteria bacterium]